VGQSPQEPRPQTLAGPSPSLDLMEGPAHAPGRLGRLMAMPGGARVSSLHLSNFKAFETFRINFPTNTLIVGPNNAGKSTVIAALRASARMLKLASSRPPEVSADDTGGAVLAYHLNPERTGLVEANLPHEFHNVDTRLKVQFSSKATIAAVWPKQPDESFYGSELDDEELDEKLFEDDERQPPFFYLTVHDQPQPRRPKEVRDSFPQLAAIPPLTPVEQTEVVLSEKYLRDSSETRLASRHFRNHLRLLQSQASSTHENRFHEFTQFAQPWVPEIELHSLRTRQVLGEGQEIDLFYTEPERRAQKEIAWAGDGVQVWLQLLLHLFRLQEADIIVLDEPDLYLHADLQRRLVKVLESTQAQTITASHSPEMLAEASRSSIIWVDKSRSGAVQAPKDEALADLSSSLGSQFNLRLAKALRAKTVLFVEGDDMKIIARLCQVAGTERLATESGVAVVPIGGFSNWEHIEPFKWIIDRFLLKSVTTFVVLDRDYRPPAAVAAVEARLTAIGIQPHVWSRKELESYLIEASLIARVSGASIDSVDAMLESICSGFKQSVFARALEEQRSFEIGPKSYGVSVTERFQKVFEKNWKNAKYRRIHTPPKELLHSVNSELQAAGFKTVSARSLASTISFGELDIEVIELLQRIEGSLD
jgi:predicted ATPase